MSPRPSVSKLSALRRLMRCCAMLILVPFFWGAPASAWADALEDVLQRKRYGLGLGLEIDGARHVTGHRDPYVLSGPSYRPTVTFTWLPQRWNHSRWLLLLPFELSGERETGRLSTGDLLLSQRTMWGAASIELRGLCGQIAVGHIRLRVGVGAERFEVADAIAGLSDVDWKAHGEVAFLTGVRFFSLVVVEFGISNQWRVHDFTFRDAAWHEPRLSYRIVGRFGLEYRFNSLTN